MPTTNDKTNFSAAYQATLAANTTQMLLQTENSGNIATVNSFTYSGIGNSTYSFGVMQFDVKNNPSSQTFLSSIGFSQSDIASLSQQGGLSSATLATLNGQLQAHLDQLQTYTNTQAQTYVTQLNSLVNYLDNTNPTAANAIRTDPALQLAIIDYNNQFNLGGLDKSTPPANSMLAYLSGQTVTLTGDTLKLAGAPDVDSIQDYINSTLYGVNNPRPTDQRITDFNTAIEQIQALPTSVFTLPQDASVIQSGNQLNAAASQTFQLSPNLNGLAENISIDAEGNVVMSVGGASIFNGNAGSIVSISQIADEVIAGVTQNLSNGWQQTATLNSSGSLVQQLSCTPQNSGDTFSYSLTSGTSGSNSTGAVVSDFTVNSTVYKSGEGGGFSQAAISATSSLNDAAQSASESKFSSDFSATQTAISSGNTQSLSVATQADLGAYVQNLQANDILAANVATGISSGEALAAPTWYADAQAEAAAEQAAEALALQAQIDAEEAQAAAEAEAEAEAQAAAQAQADQDAANGYGDDGWNSWCSSYDPLVLSVNDKGINLIPLSQSKVNYSFTGADAAIHTGWVGDGTGLLAYVNGAGDVTNGTQLFSGASFFASGATTGFQALAALDSNKDGVVDANDSAFSNLAVWVDANKNGVAEAGELESLSSLGIKSIGLSTRTTLENVGGNIITEVGTVTFNNGTTETIDDVRFATGGGAGVTSLNGESASALAYFSQVMEGLPAQAVGTANSVAAALNERLAAIQASDIQLQSDEAGASKPGALAANLIYTVSSSNKIVASSNAPAVVQQATSTVNSALGLVISAASDLATAVNNQSASNTDALIANVENTAIGSTDDAAAVKAAGQAEVSWQKVFNDMIGAAAGLQSSTAATTASQVSVNSLVLPAGVLYASTSDAREAADAIAEQKQALNGLAIGQVADQALMSAIATAWGVNGVDFATNATNLHIAGNDLVVASGNSTVIDGAQASTYAILASTTLQISNFIAGPGGSRLDFLSQSAAATITQLSTGTQITVGASTVLLVGVKASSLSLADNFAGVTSVQATTVGLTSNFSDFDNGSSAVRLLTVNDVTLFLPSALARLTSSLSVVGAGGSDLMFFRDSAGELLAWKVDSTGTLINDSFVLKYNGTPVIVSDGSTVVGTTTGTNSLNVFVRSGNGQVSVLPMASNGALSDAPRLLENAGTPVVIDQYTSVIGSGTNLYGTGEKDVFLRNSSGQIIAWEIGANGDLLKQTVVSQGGSVQANYYLAGKNQNIGIASGNTVAVSDNAQGTINGVSDTILLGTLDHLTVNGGAMSVIETGSQSTLIANGNGSNFSVFGNRNTLTANGNGDAVVLAGTGNTLTIGNGTVSLFDDNQAIINGYQDTISLGDRDQAVINGSAMTVSTSGGNSVITVNGDSENLAVVGDANTITANGQHSSISLNGLANIVTSGGSAIGLSDGSSATINGESDTINLGSSDLVTLNGGTMVVNLSGNNDQLAANGNADTLSLIGNSNTLTAYGDHDSIVFGGRNSTLGTGGSSIAIIDNSSVTVNGFNDTINFGNGDQAIVNGGSMLMGIAGNVNTVTLNGNDETVTVAGNANTLSVNGQNSTVALAGLGNNVTTANNKITFADGSSAILNGEGDFVTLNNNVSVTMNGGTMSVGLVGNNNTLAVNGNSELLSLAGNNNIVTAYGQNDSISFGGLDSSLSTGGSQIVVTNGSRIVVNGYADVVNLGDSDQAVINGGSMQLSVAGSANAITVNGDSETIVVAGNANILSANGQSSTISLSGLGNVVTTAGNQISLANGSSATVNGLDDDITASSNIGLTLNGNAMHAVFVGNNDNIAANGNENTISAIGNNNVLNAYGQNDVITFGGQNSVLSTGGSSVSIEDNSLVTINGVSDTIHLNSNNQLLINGDTMQVVVDGTENTLTTNGLGNSVTVNGNGDVVTANGSSGSVLTIHADNDIVTANGDGALIVANGNNNHLYANGRLNGFEISGLDNTVDTSGSAIDVKADSSARFLGGNNQITLADNVSATELDQGSNVIMSGGNSTLTANISYGEVLISGGNDALVESGQYNQITIAGQGDVVSLNSYADKVSVTGTGEVLSVNGAMVSVASGGETTLTGGGDIVSLSSEATLVETGNSSNDWIQGAYNDLVTLHGSGQGVQFSGTGNQLIVDGNGQYAFMSAGLITEESGSDLKLNGNNNVISIAASSSLTAMGDGNAVTATGAQDVVSITGINNTLQVSNGSVTVSTAASTGTSGTGFSVQGIALPASQLGDYASAASASSIQALATTGANSITLVATQYVDSVDSSSITTTSADGKLSTESDANIVTAIEQAKALGLNVLLSPHLNIVGSQGDQIWQAELNPADTAAFFQNYTAVVLDYAQIAQQYGVATLSIGDELSALSGQQYQPYWDELIAQVRQVYSGQLTYSSAWSETNHVSFWGELDVIGANAYIPVTGVANPTLEQLTAGWQNVSSDAYAAAAMNGQSPVAFYQSLSTTYGKPVVFTEIGYRSVNGTNMLEGDNSNTATTYVDFQQQALAYEAFYSVWSQNHGAWMQGAYAWDWNPTPDQELTNDFGLQNKPALNVLEAWYKGAADPATPTGSNALNGSNDAVNFTGSNQTLTIAGNNNTVTVSGKNDAVGISGANNTVVYNSGSGTLEIADGNHGVASTTTLKLATGITGASLRISADSGGDLILTDGVSGDLIQVDGLLNAAGAGIGQLQFSDGSTISANQLASIAKTINGTTGSDTLSNTVVSGNIFDGKGGDDIETGNTGNNTYITQSGYGALTINNGSSSNNVASGSLSILNESIQDIWLKKVGNDLELDIMGTNTEATVKGWFSDSYHQLNSIAVTDSNGVHSVLDTQLNQLVQAMATYSAQNPGFDPTTPANSAITDSSLLALAASSYHH